MGWKKMQHNLTGQKHIPSFLMKKHISGMLSRELRGCSFHIILGFEAVTQERMCSLKFLDKQRLEVCVNLSHVKRSINDSNFTMPSKVNFCVLYIADYIRQIDRARRCIPQSYFEGLTFFNAVEVYKSSKAVSIYSPLYRWGRKKGGNNCIRPIEINCTINSLNRMRLFMLSEISEKEKLSLDTIVDKLLLYASLPEIAYNATKLPVYALANSIKKLSAIITKYPEIIREFPVLMISQFDQIEQLTTKDLLYRYVQSDNNFLKGIAIRIIGFMQYPNERINDEYIFEKLALALNQYIECSLTYYTELSDSGDCFLKDNMYAVKKAVRAINDYLRIYGRNVNSGNIHFY